MRSALTSHGARRWPQAQRSFPPAHGQHTLAFELPHSRTGPAQSLAKVAPDLISTACSPCGVSITRSISWPTLSRQKKRSAGWPALKRHFSCSETTQGSSRAPRARTAPVMARSVSGRRWRSAGRCRGPQASTKDPSNTNQTPACDQGLSTLLCNQASPPSAPCRARTLRVHPEAHSGQPVLALFKVSRARAWGGVLAP